MQVKDIFASGNGSGTQNSTLIKESAKRKAQQVRNRSGGNASTPVEASPPLAQPSTEKTTKSPYLAYGQQNSLANDGNNEYSEAKSPALDVSGLLAPAKSVVSRLPDSTEVSYSAALAELRKTRDALADSAPKASDSWRELSRKLEAADSRPEIAEILGNANPSKSPAKVAELDWRGNKVRDISDLNEKEYRIERQYQNNKSIDLSTEMDDGGHINGQESLTEKKIAYGYADPGETACESIAVFNVLADFGKKTELADIIRTADENNYMRLGGIMGLFPRDTERLMTDYGISYKPASAPMLQKYADDGYMLDRERFVVVTQLVNPLSDDDRKHRYSLHTFLLVYDSDGTRDKKTGVFGHWIAYNRYGNSDDPIVYKRLEDVPDSRNRFYRIYEITGVEDHEDS